MARPPKLRMDGLPDGRGQAEASRATQFKPGGKGGPGRPKGRKSLSSIYNGVAQMPVTLTIGGQSKRITTAEAIALKDRAKALEGEDRAIERMVKRFEQYGPPEPPSNETAMLLAEDEELLAAFFQRGQGSWVRPPSLQRPVEPHGGDQEEPDEREEAA